MDRDQALQEVHEIKQVMEESRRRSSRGKCWIIIAAALLAMVISGIVPPLAPIIGIGMIVGGIIVWRKNSDPVIKAIAAGVCAVGIVLILVTVFVVIGLVAYNVSGIFPAQETIVPMR